MSHSRRYHRGHRLQTDLAAAKANQTSRSYWDWHEIIKQNKNGSWPYTPATNLLYGLKEAISMLMEEGLDNVFARHLKLAGATRAAVRAWNLEILCQDPHEYSPILTAVVMPTGHDADHFRDVALKNYDMSLGAGLSKVKGKVFRIGHLGHFNELMLMGTLSGVEMALDLAKVPHRTGGVLAAMEVLKGKDMVPVSTHLALSPENSRDRIIGARAPHPSRCNRKQNLDTAAV